MYKFNITINRYQSVKTIANQQTGNVAKFFVQRHFYNVLPPKFLVFLVIVFLGSLLLY